jgi:hypothetical protein
MANLSNNPGMTSLEWGASVDVVEHHGGWLRVKSPHCGQRFFTSSAPPSSRLIRWSISKCRFDARLRALREKRPGKRLPAGVTDGNEVARPLSARKNAEISFAMPAMLEHVGSAR